ncbi:MAG: hypothetical protein FDX21_03275 [Chlorobium sp.]|nr:MAG: hypothetical protein FDX21_03275 [Chlorobium sp.]
MQQSEDIKVVNAFINEWIISANVKSVLHIKASTFNLFSNLFDIETQEVKAAEFIPTNAHYDLILGDIPLAMGQDTWNNGVKLIKAQHNWLEILQSLLSLEENGSAIFVLEPRGFGFARGIAFEKELNEHGFFVNAYVNCPERILLPETVITPVLAVLSKKKVKQLFVAELLDEYQASQVVRNYFSNTDNGNLASGKYINAGDYYGFHRIKAKERIECLESQYKTYKEYCLGDLVVQKDNEKQINRVATGEQFQETENAVYIPTIGNSPVISKLEDAKLKHQNYFQVVLGDLAINDYVASFFNSTLGKLIIDSLTSGSFIPHLNKRDIEQALVALPGLDEQKHIVQTHHKLHELKVAINTFDAELAINPTSSNAILGQLDMMLEAIGALTDADKVRGLVREGESKYLEFKETLSLDVKKQTKEKYIEDSALKTVVAFLNTDGGKLLIGVSDTGAILGLNVEIDKFDKSLDKFLLRWKNFVKNRVGEAFYPFIEYKVINVDDKYILLVECERSPRPCYLDTNDFYVRTNPATDKLEGPKLVEYVQNHFK